jgi:hypothetical protein
MNGIAKLLMKYASLLILAGTLLGFTLKVESRISRLEGSYDLILDRLSRIENKLDAFIRNKTNEK